MKLISPEQVEEDERTRTLAKFTAPYSRTGTVFLLVRSRRNPEMYPLGGQTLLFRSKVDPPPHCTNTFNNGINNEYTGTRSLIDISPCFCGGYEDLYLQLSCFHFAEALLRSM